MKLIEITHKNLVFYLKESMSPLQRSVVNAVREVITVYSDSHIKSMKTVCGQVQSY
jgi:hypothetical protein